MFFMKARKKIGLHVGFAVLLVLAMAGNAFAAGDVSLKASGGREGGGMETSEDYYHGSDTFGYDAMTEGETLEGITVSVGQAELSQGNATSTTGAVMENNDGQVTITFEPGYYLESYKVVCGDKYDCQTDEQGNVTVKDYDESYNADHASITISLTKSDFGHSNEKGPYWLLLTVGHDEITHYTVTYEWGELSEELAEYSVPVDEKSGSYIINDSVAILGITEDVIKAAYEAGYEFAGWQRQSTETIYYADTHFYIVTDEVLIAQWKPITYTYTCTFEITKYVGIWGETIPDDETFDFVIMFYDGSESMTAAALMEKNSTIVVKGADIQMKWTKEVDGDEWTQVLESEIKASCVTRLTGASTIYQKTEKLELIIQCDKASKEYIENCTMLLFEDETNSADEYGWKYDTGCETYYVKKDCKETTEESAQDENTVQKAYFVNTYVTSGGTTQLDEPSDDTPAPTPETPSGGSTETSTEEETIIEVPTEDESGIEVEVEETIILVDSEDTENAEAIIENEADKSAETSTAPKTGDERDLITWICLLLATGSILGVLMAVRRKDTCLKNNR